MTDTIMLAHGGGGEKTNRLVEELFLSYLNDPVLRQFDDAARLESMVFTTDSFVVSPLFFPGGDIGRLCVSGTVNDLAVMGARPRYMSLGFIIEEGFPIAELRKILQSIRETADESGIRIVTGDTKVVERGRGDGIYISCSGVGEIVYKNPPGFSRIAVGDVILINGSIGLHAAAIVAARGEFGLRAAVESDVAPLWPFLESLSGYDVTFMRDPTRGGVAQTLNEIATATGMDLEIGETEIPVSDPVRGLCDLLGYDPLYLANEGKVVLLASPRDAGKIAETMKNHPLGRDTRVIGLVRSPSGKRGRVLVRTLVGSQRLLMPPPGELLPRIC